VSTATAHINSDIWLCRLLLNLFCAVPKSRLFAERFVVVILPNSNSLSASFCSLKLATTMTLAAIARIHSFIFIKIVLRAADATATAAKSVQTFSVSRHSSYNQNVWFCRFLQQHNIYAIEY